MISHSSTLRAYDLSSYIRCLSDFSSFLKLASLGLEGVVPLFASQYGTTGRAAEYSLNDQVKTDPGEAALHHPMEHALAGRGGETSGTTPPK
jgi:hypothetical protein